MQAMVQRRSCLAAGLSPAAVVRCIEHQHSNAGPVVLPRCELAYVVSEVADVRGNTTPAISPISVTFTPNLYALREYFPFHVAAFVRRSSADRTSIGAMSKDEVTKIGNWTT